MDRLSELKAQWDAYMAEIAQLSQRQSEIKKHLEVIGEELYDIEMGYKQNFIVVQPDVTKSEVSP